MEVYKAISAVMDDLSKEGMAKSRNNAQQGYKFRGIDDVYLALSSKLVKHGLLMLPQYDGHHFEQRGTTSKGSAVYGAVLRGTIDLVSVVDGSKHTIHVYGEGSDSADKATNKAMSAAYKYAAIQAFCIPCEGNDDGDADHNEVVRQYPAPAPKATVSAEPKDRNNYTRQIATASNMEELMTIGNAMGLEVKSVRDAHRQQFKERMIELGGK